MRASQVLFRRTRHFQMTTKRGPRNFYKGTRTGSTGTHTKHGGYVLDYNKIRTYAGPSKLEECKLTPFVSYRVKPLRVRNNYGPHGSSEYDPISGMFYLKQWKEKNGQN